MPSNDSPTDALHKFTEVSEELLYQHDRDSCLRIIIFIIGFIVFAPFMLLSIMFRSERGIKRQYKNSVLRIPTCAACDREDLAVIRYTPETDEFRLAVYNDFAQEFRRLKQQQL